MIHLNMRPGDQIMVGKVLVRFVEKGARTLPNGAVLRYSRFEVGHAGAMRRHDLAFSKRLDLPGCGAFFFVEKQSGRSARISLEAPPTVAFERLMTPPLVPEATTSNNHLRCQGETR